ncbi:hypothetical protein R69746_08037 [Paraburkholderia aspalathi]|uniref:hypothetical protein n=1 Tax=Paraburkholderia aspalathi TaxID=1324617 RepID=UPI00190DE658|nr:hypothetical protein [Paraburkholderia aspalathi]MBK3844000.1 hypothetical protein [Paraburkholderia aspalathi]CAE6864992.1 hypothetical protein R69746_08037 [Paraburkholderia aspalathi]CAE6867920.1 hypothetical protein R75465_08091 [Paraburkholderia aspalathi]
MNIVSIDAVGGLLPLAVSLLYLPRTVRALGWFYGAIFGLSMLISTHFSYCDSNAVHVAPGTILLCVALWLPRARGQNMEVPAAAIFTLAFIAGFPVDVYLGYVCHAASGTARVGGAGLSDGLIVGPASLALVHLGIYYFCELDEKGKVQLGDFLKTHFAVTRPTFDQPASTSAEPS